MRRMDIDLSGIAVSDAQHVQDVLECNRGDFKFSPQMGCNAISFLKKKDGKRALVERAKTETQKDGYLIKIKEKTDGTIAVEL